MATFGKICLKNASPNGAALYIEHGIGFGHVGARGIGCDGSALLGVLEPAQFNFEDDGRSAGVDSVSSAFNSATQAFSGGFNWQSERSHLSMCQICGVLYVCPWLRMYPPQR